MLLYYIVTLYLCSEAILHHFKYAAVFHHCVCVHCSTPVVIATADAYPTVCAATAIASAAPTGDVVVHCYFYQPYYCC